MPSKYTIQLPCTTCGTLHDKPVSNQSSAVERYTSGKRKAFCSTACRQEWFKTKRRTAICKTCNREFHNRTGTRQFCSKECYSLDMSANPTKYNLVEKARHASSFGNTEDSIAKMKNTKLKNGTMIDPSDLSWKQFWKRCDRITRQKRVRLLEDWDGYDAISGEFIKNNCNLHFSHGEYPTLDHIVPKSECYRLGETPEEACRDSNLRWTTRRNNASKGNRLT